jgi:hypothetical protein
MEDKSMGRDDQAYKGYLIRFGTVGRVWVEKEGYNISAAKDVDDARSIIDMLTESSHG